MIKLWIAIVIAVAAFGLGILACILAYQQKAKRDERKIADAEEEALRIVNEAIKNAESKKREALVEAKEEILRSRTEYEKEVKERRADLQKQERRLQQKEENIDRKTEAIERKEEALAAKHAAADKEQEEIRLIKRSQTEMLERISGLTRDEAKALIIKSLENEARHDAQALLNKVDQEAQLAAEKKAQKILITAMQRLASETTGDNTVATVSLPSDEMKGRIIGREGRNIRTLETLTGVDIIIDDTPEAVVISCFDPVRKEIAKQALERLITDGRIHPSRIEEIVQKVTREIQQKIYEEGEKALFDLGVHNMSQEGVRAIGRLYFRTSYGQSVLVHSKEVAEIASMLAAEIGCNRELAKRAALLHDIGKGAEVDSDQNHAEVGAEMARKMGEDPRVVNAIASHHNDVEPQTPEAVLVQIADAISAARPGARRETVDNYVKRLENLEATARRFEGVEQAYAIQAGRELRILVNNEKIADEQVKELAKSIAKQIEDDLQYPGRIKITMIRETRIIEYAR